MKWVLIAVIYLVGAFITKIVITIHDHYATLHNRIDDFDVVAMTIWFIFLPLIIIAWLLNILYKKCEDIGDWICQKLKQ